MKNDDALLIKAGELNIALMSIAGGYIGTLIRLDSVHKNMRTDEMLGMFHKMPTVGVRFNIVGQSLDPNKTARIIDTSPVAEIISQTEDVIEFKTLNTHYRIELEKAE